MRELTTPDTAEKIEHEPNLNTSFIRLPLWFKTQIFSRLSVKIPVHPWQKNIGGIPRASTHTRGLPSAARLTTPHCPAAFLFAGSREANCLQSTRRPPSAARQTESRPLTTDH